MIFLRRKKKKLDGSVFLVKKPCSLVNKKHKYNKKCFVFRAMETNAKLMLTAMRRNAALVISQGPDSVVAKRPRETIAI